ncbi:MAG: glycosyltransferase family 4 protein [Planctomycetes bacterium]|nr:glycosyltransferase family 4 protein [Planctomycetota bacterium]
MTAAAVSPMRVLRVLTRPNLGGPTRQAIALWHAMQPLAVRTLLVTGRVGAGETMLDPAAHGVPRLEFAAALAAGPLAEGVVELPDLGRSWAPLRERAVRAQLRALVRSFRPDVVHTHTSKAGWLGRDAARAERVPVVAHTFHGHVLDGYFPFPIAWWLARLERRLARGTDLVFTVSASCADELAAKGVVGRDRFLVIPPAVALPPRRSRDEARRNLGIPPGERRVAAIGRLVPIKRLGDFVAAVARCPGLHGDLVGDGPQRQMLQALCEQLAPGRVHLRGAVPGIAADLAAYDGLVLPSVREGWPLVALEAFAANVPVVGYDVPGVRDALAQGRGMLVPETAGPAGLADTLQELANGPRGLGSMLAAAAAFVPQCAPDRVARGIRAAYATALSRR